MESMKIDRLAIPREATQALAIAQRCLGNALLAVCIHGSSVSGGLRPDSDVDLLAVIDRPMTPEIRKTLVAGLMKISGRYPIDADGRRPLELIVFRDEDLKPSVYPARSEFVYGEWLRGAFRAGEIPGPVSDPEFTLLLGQARQEARPLIGPDPAELLPVIPEADIRRAIGDALPTLLGTLEGDERNVLLTLARMWRTLTTGEFVPKDVAAEWAVQRLSLGSAALLEDAREAYLGLRTVDRRGRRRDVGEAAGELSRRVAAML